MRRIGIAGEHLGHEEFTADWWANGELYFDDGKKDIFPVMGSGTSIGKGLMSLITGGTVWKTYQRTKAAGIAGNLEGEGTKLGGVWVVGAGEQGILFEHQEKNWGDNVCASNMEGLQAAVAAIVPAA